ncbi:MAG: response regulator [Anaerolineales bacterium]|nr:response regulator [Anaerolineales bacterium]
MVQYRIVSLEAQQPAELNFEEYSILIVDDNPANLEIIVDYLERYGFGIRVARSGDSTLQKARYAPPESICSSKLVGWVEQWAAEAGINSG